MRRLRRLAKRAGRGTGGAGASLTAVRAGQVEAQAWVVFLLLHVESLHPRLQTSRATACDERPTRQLVGALCTRSTFAELAQLTSIAFPTLMRLQQKAVMGPRRLVFVLALTGTPLLLLLLPVQEQ
jgi:hypothetical protein